jgi:hypothetical protein
MNLKGLQMETLALSAEQAKSSKFRLGADLKPTGLLKSHVWDKRVLIWKHEMCFAFAVKDGVG